jgi:hypothetical protein
MRAPLSRYFSTTSKIIIIIIIFFDTGSCGGAQAGLELAM